MTKQHDEDVPTASGSPWSLEQFGSQGFRSSSMVGHDHVGIVYGKPDEIRSLVARVSERTGRKLAWSGFPGVNAGSIRSDGDIELVSKIIQEEAGNLFVVPPSQLQRQRRD